MAKSIAVEVFRNSPVQREEARKRASFARKNGDWTMERLCLIDSGAFRVRFWNEETQEYVDGGGSSRRVAAMRAAEAAVAKGWF